MTRNTGGMAISPKRRYRTRLEDAASTLIRQRAEYTDDKAGAG